MYKDVSIYRKVHSCKKRVLKEEIIMELKGAGGAGGGIGLFLSSFRSYESQL
jgi:hypothetical protein